MLITLIGVQFSRSAYESAFYMNVFSYLLLDGMSLLFFKAALSLGKKRRRSIEGEYYTIGTLLFTCQFLWLYILSYKLIYIKEASLGLLTQALGFLIVTDVVVFFSAVRIIRQKRKKQELDTRTQMNAELAAQLEKLAEKQAGLETVFHEMHDPDAQIDHLQVLRGRLRKLREELYCENPYANALFNYYRQLCDQKQIAVTFEIESSLCGILDEYDLNTLLSNLLKNAVEAAEFSDSPFIDFQAAEKAGLLLIRCRNRVAKNGPQPKKKISGQGTAIMDAILHRCHGVRRFSLDQDIATAEIVVERGKPAKSC